MEVLKKIFSDQVSNFGWLDKQDILNDFQTSRVLIILSSSLNFFGCSGNSMFALVLGDNPKCADNSKISFRAFSTSFTFYMRIKGDKINGTTSQNDKRKKTKRHLSKRPRPKANTDNGIRLSCLP
jgi:hypothetical protein